MGLIRKTLSVSTVGGVKYTSRREAQTKAASAQARAANQETKQLKAQARAANEEAKAQRRQETGQQWDEILAAFEAGEVTWDDLSRMQKLTMPITYQVKCKAAQRRQSRQPEQAGQPEQAEQGSFQWDEILAAFEAGEMTWGDLTRTQKAKMPVGYQVKCRRAATQRRRAAV